LWGFVRAGNSSIIADGAAALVLVLAERASELGLRVSCLSPHVVDFVPSQHIAYPVEESCGKVTAGNSSVFTDGAAALVLMSAERASQLGLRVSHWSPHTVDCAESVHE